MHKAQEASYLSFHLNTVRFSQWFYSSGSPCLDSSRSPRGHTQDLLGQPQQVALCSPSALSAAPSQGCSVAPFPLLLHRAVQRRPFRCSWTSPALRPEPGRVPVTRSQGKLTAHPILCSGREGNSRTEPEAPGEASRSAESPRVQAQRRDHQGTLPEEGNHSGREGEVSDLVICPETKAGAALGKASTNPASARHCLWNFAGVRSPPDSSLIN